MVKVYTAATAVELFVSDRGPLVRKEAEGSVASPAGQSLLAANFGNSDVFDSLRCFLGTTIHNHPGEIQSGLLADVCLHSAATAEKFRVWRTNPTSTTEI
eukprot:3801655-Amphidinium_carterae.1